MDVNKNSYTFAFSAILVIVVAAVLAFAAESLKPMQKENVRIEKMQNILASVKVETTKENASEMFDQYIVEQIMLNHKGEVNAASDLNPFDVDAVVEYRGLSFEERNYPLFIYENNGERKYIVPMAGSGLWGPIWGYVALNNDMNTVFGSTFDHRGETPGLGAEIKEAAFQEKFINKAIFDQAGNYKSVEVVKGGTPVDDNPHAVDGISGGTITSKGVGEMLERTFEVYVPYFKQQIN